MRPFLFIGGRRMCRRRPERGTLHDRRCRVLILCHAERAQRTAHHFRKHRTGHFTAIVRTHRLVNDDTDETRAAEKLGIYPMSKLAVVDDSIAGIQSGLGFEPNAR